MEYSHQLSMESYRTDGNAMLSRVVIVVIISISVGIAIGYAAAYRMASFAAPVGGLYGAIAGAISSPIVLACLHRRNLFVGMIAVFGPASFVALISSAAMNPLWSVAISIGIVSSNSILCYFLLPERPPNTLWGSCQTCGYDLTGNRSGICPECGNSTRTHRSEYSAVRILLTAVCFLLIPAVLAYLALGRIADRATPKEIPALIQRLAHHDMQLRYNAQQELLKHGTGPLLSALQSEQPRVRASAAEALGWMNNSSVGHAIAQLLQDRDSHVRLSAINALEKIGDSSSVRHIRKMLNDSDINVRHDAIRALGTLDARTAAPSIAQHLGDPIAYIVREAAETLGKLRYTDAIPKLIGLLRDPRDYVSESSLIAIARIDGQQLPEASWQKQLESARGWWEREGKNKYAPLD